VMPAGAHGAREPIVTTAAEARYRPVLIRPLVARAIAGARCSFSSSLPRVTPTWRCTSVVCFSFGVASGIGTGVNAFAALIVTASVAAASAAFINDIMIFSIAFANRLVPACLVALRDPPVRAGGGERAHMRVTGSARIDHAG